MSLKRANFAKQVTQEQGTIFRFTTQKQTILNTSAIAKQFKRL